jgi:hypothetical protein
MGKLDSTRVHSPTWGARNLVPSCPLPLSPTMSTSPSPVSTPPWYTLPLTCTTSRPSHAGTRCGVKYTSVRAGAEEEAAEAREEEEEEEERRLLPGGAPKLPVAPPPPLATALEPPR